MDLSNLSPAEGSVMSDNFRRGRGHGSGNGKTAGKGHKGQKARSGAPRPGFEGGQMPLYRRIPKRGFTNRNRKEFVAINISTLERFDNGAEVTVDTLIESGIVSTAKSKLKRNPMIALSILNKLKENDCIYTDISASELMYIAQLAGRTHFSMEDVTTIPGEVKMGEEFEEYHTDSMALKKIVLENFYTKVK